MALNKWRSNSSTQGNQLLKVEDYDTFMEVWPHFVEGHAHLVAPEGANMTNLTIQEMFKTCLELAVYPEYGFLALLVNKRGEFLGFVAAHDTSIAFRPKELTLFAIFSNKQCPSTTRELMFEVKMWAKAQGFTRVLGVLHKKSGIGIRFFNHVLNMRHAGLVFQAEL